MKALWRHNLASALIAERLASAGFLDKDTAYTSGILHDIGRVALAVLQPKDYGNLLATHKGSPASILEDERHLFGWDHCETGKQLVADWKLPSDFEAIVSEHHCAREQGRKWGMTELTQVSCRMADAVGFSAFHGCETTPFEELLDELPVRERTSFCANLETLTAEITESIHAIESV